MTKKNKKKKTQIFISKKLEPANVLPEKSVTFHKGSNGLGSEELGGHGNALGSCWGEWCCHEGVSSEFIFEVISYLSAETTQISKGKHKANFFYGKHTSTCVKTLQQLHV